MKLLILAGLLFAGAAVAQPIPPSKVTPAGGSVSMTFGAAFGLTLNGAYWGVLDGRSDNASAIQAAVNYLQAQPFGGQVQLPAGGGNIASTVSITKSNVRVLSYGNGSTHHDVGAQSVGGNTVLTWTGAAGGTMFSVAPISDPVNGQNISNDAVSGIVLNCNNLAAQGLYWASSSKGVIDVQANECTTAGLTLDTVALGEFNDPQSNMINLTATNVTNAGTGLVLDGTGSGGASDGNTSFNWFHNVSMTILNGDGIHCNYGDHNSFDQIKITRRSGGTGNAVIFNGSNASVGHVCYNERIGVLSSNAPSIARGTTTFTFPSTGNVIDWLDLANSTPVPTVETGATMSIRTDSGRFLSIVSGPVGSGANSFIAGGSGNSVNGANAFVGAGSGNNANGFGSSIFGQNTTTSGTDSAAFGSGNAGSGSNTLIAGNGATDRGRRSAIFLAPSQTNAVGDHQRSWGGLQGVASSTTAVRLTSDANAAAATNCINIPNNTAYSITAWLLAFDHTNPAKSFAASWGLNTAPHILARGANAAATLIDGVATTIAADLTRPIGTLTGIGATIQADTTIGCVNMTFTPPTSNADTWTLSGGVDTLEGQ
jgi:trimeric autotransporter adhesin